MWEEKLREANIPYQDSDLKAPRFSHGEEKSALF